MLEPEIVVTFLERLHYAILLALSIVLTYLNEGNLEIISDIYIPKWIDDILHEQTTPSS